MTQGAEIYESDSESNRSNKVFKCKYPDVQITQAKSEESQAESQLHIKSKSKEVKAEQKVDQLKPKKPSMFKRLQRFMSKTSKKTDQEEASQKNQVIEEISSNEENLDDKVSRILYDELNSKLLELHSTDTNAESRI